MPTYQLSSLSFRVMTWMFRVRDLLRPRERILAEAALAIYCNSV